MMFKDVEYKNSYPRKAWKRVSNIDYLVTRYLKLILLFYSAEDEADGDDGLDGFMPDTRLAIAYAKLKAKEIEEAETNFCACIFENAVLRTLPDHIIIELNLGLASACRGSGKYKDQQKIISDLLQFDVLKAQQLHFQHNLAVTYLDDPKS